MWVPSNSGFFVLNMSSIKVNLYKIIAIPSEEELVAMNGFNATCAASCE